MLGSSDVSRDWRITYSDRDFILIIPHATLSGMHYERDQFVYSEVSQQITATVYDGLCKTTPICM